MHRNHLFTQSATSCGIADNILWNQCGGNKSTFPQVTVYDNLALGNASFGFYINTTLPDLWEIVGGGWAENTGSDLNGSRAQKQAGRWLEWQDRHTDKRGRSA